MTGSAAGGLIAFLGPSLSRAEAEAAAPGVRFLPPICQGDLSTVLEFDRPAGVLIVDGEFGQSLSVWHKEIVRAISRGVRVLGASSMGALRAAELDRYGMEGVGVIYEHYRDNFLTADEDVALVHADADDGWKPLTWPLVNIRATVGALAAAGLLKETEAAAILDAANSLHFRDRVAPALIARLEQLGWSQAARLVGLVREHHVDQKRLDALAGLDLLTRIDVVPKPDHEDAEHLAGRNFGLRFCDVTITRPTGRLFRYQLVNDAALHLPDFTSLAERATDRYLVLDLAREFDVRPTPANVEAERAAWLKQRGLTPETLAEWLATNDLDDESFEELMTQQATLRWMRRHQQDLRFYERNRRMVIEQLQLEGRYAEVADAAARRRQLVIESGGLPYPRTPEEVYGLFARHAAANGWRPTDDLLTLADDQGFEGSPGLVVAVADAAAAAMESARRRQRVAEALGFSGPSTESPSPQGPATNGAAPAAARGPLPQPMAANGTPVGAPARGNPALSVHALLESHQITQVLLAAVELGVPGALADGPLTLDQLAERIGGRADRLGRLLQALVPLGLLTKRSDGSWELTESGRWLDPAREHSFDAYARDLRRQSLPAWACLADAIRDGAAAADEADPSQLADEAIAAAGAAMDLPAIVEHHLELAAGTALVELGGGLGGLAEAIAEHHPDVSVTLVELAGTAERAAARLAATPAGSRVSVQRFGERPAGAPPDADCIVAARVVLNLDDHQAGELLRHAAARLRPGGRIEIFDVRSDGSLIAGLADLFNLARSGGTIRDETAWHALAATAGLSVERATPIRPPLIWLTLRPATSPEANA